MARPIEVEVEGLRELQDALRGTSSALGGEFTAAMVDTAGMIVRGAQSRVPRLTGKARNSIRVMTEGGEALIVAGAPLAPYFHILEFGSKFVRGGRYLTRAVEGAADDVEQAALMAFERTARREGLDVG